MVQSVRRSCFAVALLLASGATAPVLAAPILQVSGGILIGATGVSVNGTLYDVTFTDGSCASAYDGCNAITDLPFTTQTAADDASQALLDQVFVDGPSGLFDSMPGLTFGCSVNSCLVWTPFTIGLSASIAYNAPLLGDTVSSGTAAPTLLFSGIQDGVLADWTPAATPVPEPTSMLLLGTGLLGAGVRRWRQKRA